MLGSESATPLKAPLSAAFCPSLIVPPIFFLHVCVVWGWLLLSAALLEVLGLQGATNLLVALSYFRVDEMPLFESLLSQASKNTGCGSCCQGTYCFLFKYATSCLYE